MKKAFITGVTGQDGAWLAKLLLEKGYEVFGGVRRTSTLNTWRLDFLGITNQVKLIEFDLLDYSNIHQAITTTQPDEFYNLAAQSFVGTSFKQPISTCQIDGMGVAYILDIIKNFSPETKFYQASTSELYGLVREVPQTENTPFHPRSPYACAKAMAHYLTVNYRESYNIFACTGILFNHESELRGPEFVTRKVTLNVANWALGRGETLQIGNLEAQRDWGYAKEYVEGMWRMLQQDQPDTYILATGKTTKIRTFIENAFAVIDRQIRWEGEGDHEKGYDQKTGELLVAVNPDFYRPAEVELLIGDYSKAKQILGWEPQTDITELTRIMVESDHSAFKF
ncbi:MAG: GDP-mannose 4,6-dehydratase [Patescibacteria group bacterium]